MGVQNNVGAQKRAQHVFGMPKIHGVEQRGRPKHVGETQQCPMETAESPSTRKELVVARRGSAKHREEWKGEKVVQRKRGRQAECQGKVLGTCEAGNKISLENNDMETRGSMAHRAHEWRPMGHRRKRTETKGLVHGNTNTANEEHT